MMVFNDFVAVDFDQFVSQPDSVKTRGGFLSAQCVRIPSLSLAHCFEHICGPLVAQT